MIEAVVITMLDLVVAEDFRVEVMSCKDGVDGTRAENSRYPRSCDDKTEEYHDDLAQFQTHTWYIIVVVVKLAFNILHLL